MGLAGGRVAVEMKVGGDVMWEGCASLGRGLQERVVRQRGYVPAVGRPGSAAHGDRFQARR